MSEFSGKFHAIFSAYVSMFAGVVETFFSIILGHLELSMSMYGIALMAIVDITGSVLVLLIWQDGNGERNNEKRILEARYSYIIGALMMFLGIFLVMDSVKTLIKGEHLNTFQGAGISWFGTIVSFVLSAYKFRIGEELDSPVIIADAISSSCSGLTSLVALVVAYNEKFVWWLDGVAGMLVGFYTLYSGAVTMTSSSHEITELQKGHTVSHGTSSYMKLMDKRPYSSYQEGGASPGRGGGDRHFKRQATGDIGLVDIMNTRPTPYNFDNENRSQLNVFRIVYNQIVDNFVSTTRSAQSNTAAYERIPATDSDEELTFSA